MALKSYLKFEVAAYSQRAPVQCHIEGEADHPLHLQDLLFSQPSRLLQTANTQYNIIALQYNIAILDMI